MDVANSVDGRVLDDPLDYLHTYADLVDWVRRAGGLSAAQAVELHALAEADPEAADGELVRTRALRESVFGLFYGRATQGVAAAGLLAAVQESYVDALAHGRLVADGPDLRWTWEPDLRLARWLLARSAVDLATTGPSGRVKACASQDGCQYLFLDTSKNGSRRWCSMTDCGNQAKSQRLTARRRASRAAD
nr:CGNR zinc finger domain-containing protein [Cellulomonas humilata]